MQHVVFAGVMGQAVMVDAAIDLDVVRVEADAIARPGGKGPSWWLVVVRVLAAWACVRWFVRLFVCWCLALVRVRVPPCVRWSAFGRSFCLSVESVAAEATFGVLALLASHGLSGCEFESIACDDLHVPITP